MKDILMVLLIYTFFTIVITLAFIIPLENQLSDCQFKVNHLQTKIDRLEALGEYETVLYQLMPPLAWAQLRAANEICKQKRQFEFEGCEMPLTVR